MVARLFGNVVNAGRNPHFFGGMRKRGTRFAVASAAARRRTVGGQRRQTSKLCQGLQPPKAGPTAAFAEFAGLSRSAIRGAGWRPHNVICRQKSADLHRWQQMLHSHGIPAPQMQPSPSCHALSGWFSQTHPMPKQIGFLSILTNCLGRAMVRIYPRLEILV